MKGQEPHVQSTSSPDLGNQRIQRTIAWWRWSDLEGLASLRQCLERSPGKRLGQRLQGAEVPIPTAPSLHGLESHVGPVSVEGLRDDPGAMLILDLAV